jgi:hypothetical protein
MKRKRFIAISIRDFFNESIINSEIDVELFCNKNGFIFKPNKKITQIGHDYNWEDLYELYGEDYMDKENQEIVEIKDIIFSQKYVNEIDLSHSNEKPILICVLKNKKYLLDGNHRVIKSFMNNESTINAYIIYYSDLN